MTDREALLLAIKANPHDDLPRLIFADYLDENGEPERADYIRTAIEIARLEQPGSTADPTRWATFHHFVSDAQLAAIRAAGGGPSGIGNLHHNVEDVNYSGPQQWMRLFDVSALLRNRTKLSRGFIYSFRGDWDQWLKFHEELSLHPIETVELTTRPSFRLRELPLHLLRRRWPIIHFILPVGVDISDAEWIEVMNID
jgi:uncharacterized protein (TIGR02996 family)